MKRNAVSELPAKRGAGALVWTCIALAFFYVSSAQAQPLQTTNNVTATPDHCSQAEHWDAAMQMCMSDEGTAGQDENRAGSARPEVPPVPGQGPGEGAQVSSTCPPDRPFDSAMNMCMPGKVKPSASLMFHLNQFMLYSSTSGPRGKSRLTGPGTWMLMFDKPLGANNHLHVDVMGSPEQMSVGDNGTPQLLQTEHIDNMHAHDTIMALEFRDDLTFGAGGEQKLTFLFAPRGEAAVGPVPFMHRVSAEGNPDAPIGHNLQDGFHDASTVLGIGYTVGHTAIEATAFSGQGVSWPLPMHKPDSYAIRINQSIGDHYGMGASYGDVRIVDDVGDAVRNLFISAWLTTSHQIHGDSLKSTFVWGRARVGHGVALNSFLEEAVYQMEDNAVYGRVEALQIMPSQLDIELIHGGSDANWVGALTIGYERTVFRKGELALIIGGSYTLDIVPASFQPAYGSDPRGVKVYLRLKFAGSVEFPGRRR